MAHWFHRNPLKATDFAKFELKEVIKNDHASKICGELRLRRDKFLKHLESGSSDLATVEEEFKAYIALFYGFLYEIDGETDAKNSKLRHLMKFIWTNSLLGSEAIEVSDSWFEALNICMNMAIWLMKHAAWISSKDEVRDNEAKAIHSCLRKAAGIFSYILEKTEKLDGLGNFPGNDFDSKILNAYINQCTAEAQEVAIARAIELKHAPKLICALATETANKYQECDKCIGSFDPTTFDKWRRYFQLKHRFYLAYAYAYLGESLLAEDKCGMAVRACKEGIASYELAEDFCAKYAKATGPGFIAKPEKHLFFRRIQPLLKRHLEKAERENGFIYHDKVPDECPLLDNSACYGLAKIDSFSYPEKSEQWTIASYGAFDITKANMPDFGKPKKSSKKLPPVKEEKVYETDKDPNNLSGCIIS
uniref:BRO1 domain-containing protein n=1 Tax=Acrobeloides nanus TaxID=290746 RepID=A0A914CXJ7_9BILA